MNVSSILVTTYVQQISLAHRSGSCKAHMLLLYLIQRLSTVINKGSDGPGTKAIGDYLLSLKTGMTNDRHALPYTSLLMHCYTWMLQADMPPGTPAITVVFYKGNIVSITHWIAS